MTYMTEERLMIQRTAQEFAREIVLPVANRLDPLKEDIPESLRKQLAEMGYFGILVPEQYGGLGLGCFEYCLITEELSRAWMSVGSIIRNVGLMVAQGMTEEQKSAYLPRMARGEFLGAFSMSEPNAGSDISNLSTRAEKVAGGWKITGSKYWCTFADGADYIVVIARTAPPPAQSKRHLGLSAFMIEKARGSLPEGVSGAPIPKIGYFGWKTWELAFDGFFVSENSLIGKEGEAFYLVTHGLETARAHTAARSIGLAQGALEDAIEYAGMREQFGAPIDTFQSLRFRIAHMATEVEASRQLMYSVCDKIDSGVRCDKEAAMVKYLASEMSERVTSDSLQIHGGAGYTQHFAVERHWRDARLTKIFEGTSEIQQRIIADHLLGRAK
ncbi:alkylation response protein AidB-like acyl-CoA dehydrogenase [Paraburkholderia sp. BL6669N2]|uniref:acyl-CoA dehydrogenase family protein n=1 Tax=Paraburkholderia sp. BL6669N2 TaxID=1938807 RepID=UPI000E2328B4|nr:acyl-CoA dehydrogenase family protein [Paraburkholderia sp. BL6669N2]REG50984.1 alkylation response protein AidB-like acyl-CoA dehydrogenase [Paraburkholderia sp. BL6669N2]